MRTPALILAGGESRRMGRVKALLQFEGVTLLERAYRQLKDAGADPVLTVLGSHQPVLAPVLEGLSAPWVLNPTPEEGQISSLRVGLLDLRERYPTDLPGFLMLPVDHALVASETVSAVVAAARLDSSRFAVPSYQGRRGHPTWFPAECFLELLDPALEGGARTVLRRRGESIRHLVVEDPGARLDLDTPEDWEASQQWRT